MKFKHIILKIKMNKENKNLKAKTHNKKLIKK